MLTEVHMMFIDEVKANLNDCIRPFWIGLMDKENGGFYGRKDFDLKLYKEAEKGVILNSRILWFFSNSYLFLPNDEDMACANHAFDYLMNHCLDKEYGGVYWSTNYDGTPLDTTKHTYNQAFAIYALSSYYDASKKQEALNTAFDLFHMIEEKCTDEFGYLEAFDRTFQPVENDKLSENGIIAEKTMNTLLHVFEAYTELYRVSKNAEVKEKMVRILDIFVDKVYNPQLHRQDVFFDREMNNLIDLQSYGHDIETTWLLDRGVAVLGDKEIEAKITPITNALAGYVYELAYKDNSLVNECENGVVDTTRVWWVQAETVIGFLNAYQKNPDKKEYLEAAKSVWGYIRDNIVDKRPGSEWFSEVDENRQPTSRKDIVEPWKCPYHNGRMCLEVIRRNIDVA
jgi:mannobiose 2-epimerase